MAIQVEIMSFLLPSRSMRSRANRLDISVASWRDLTGRLSLDLRSEEVDGSVNSGNDTGHLAV
jgi:hypothetical protein